MIPIMRQTKKFASENLYFLKPEQVTSTYTAYHSPQVLTGCVNYNRTFLERHMLSTQSCGVSCLLVSISEERGSTSDSLSATFVLCSDFASNSPRHKCPRGQERCTAICTAEAQGLLPYLVDDLSLQDCSAYKKLLVSIPIKPQQLLHSWAPSLSTPRNQPQHALHP